MEKNHLDGITFCSCSRAKGVFLKFERERLTADAHSTALCHSKVATLISKSFVPNNIENISLYQFYHSNSMSKI